MNCVGAVWWVFCARSYEMLCFSITLIIGHLPPFDMYCVLIIPALRAFEPTISVPQNQRRRDSQRDFAYAGSGNHSAIHVKIRPRYVRGLRTGDKRHQRGDLINVPIAVERCEGLLRYRPLARGRIRIRIDRTRLDIVGCDAPAPHLSGHPLSEHLDRSLCGRIGHEAGRQGTLTYGRTDHDDAATARHVLQRRPRRDEFTANIDVNQAVQLLQRGLLESLRNGRTGIVHKDVELAECRHGLFDRCFDGASVGGVGLNCDRLSACAFNLLDDRRGRIGTFRVCDGHVRSVRGQTLSDCSTNTARAARNECNLSLQVLRHCFSPIPLLSLFAFLLATPGYNALFSEGDRVARPIPVSAPSGSSHVSVVDSPRPRSWTDNILRTTLVRVLVRLPNEGGYEHYH